MPRPRFTLLCLCALAIALFPACSSSPSSPQLAGDTLHYPDLCLSVTKPSTWRFQSPKEKRDARRANTFKNKLYDSEVKLDAFPPRIVISKYPEPHRGLNPHISIDRYPLDDLRFKTNAWLAARIYKNRQYLFDGVALAEPIQSTLLDGKPTATFRLRYTLQVEDGPPQPVDEHFWVVATGITAYLVHARCAPDGPDAALQEIYSTVASLKFN